MRAGVGAWFAATLGVLALASPAAAVVREGKGDDAPSDARDGIAAREILGVEATVDDETGKVSVAVRLAATPTSGYVLALTGTKKTDGSCAEPFALFRADVAKREAEYGREGFPWVRRTPAPIDGTTVRIAVEDPDLAAPFDCLRAETAEGATVFDEIAPPIALNPPPPPPKQDPPPTVTQPVTPPPPPPPPTRETTLPPAKAAKLTASLGGVPSVVRRNRTMRLKLRVANDGSKASGKVTVTVAAARGCRCASARCASPR